MGLHSYICPHCQSNIRMGECAILFHVRHGVILGQSIGRYDGYGRVNPSDDFERLNDSPNSHDEIWNSKFMLEDSKVKSGISAWHIPCFKIAMKKNKKLLLELPISDGDDAQGLGRIRKKYDITREELLDIIKSSGL